MKKIEISTFLDFQYVSNPSFSPNGKYIAFVVSTADKADNAYKGNLYVYDMETKKVLKLTNGGDAKTYAWTKENTLLFPAVREKRNRSWQAPDKLLRDFPERRRSYGSLHCSGKSHLHQNSPER